MLNVEELKGALGEELRVIRHLATKLDPAKVDWRPTAEQRSTLELLRYLALCGIGPVRALTAGDWSVIASLEKSVAALGLDGFDAAMEHQERELYDALDEIGDAGLVEREATLPWGASLPLGHAIFSTSVRFLCAYRLQLFLYAKESGATELTTHNAWLGMDPPAKPA